MTININGYLSDFSSPIIMGILNATPDSFFSKSRYETADRICYRAEEIISQGGTIIDIGGYSSRPGAQEVSEIEELRRVTFATEIIRKKFPEIPISIDTFRANVAQISVSDYGASIINDISGGDLDRNMFKTVSELKVPYILMHMRGTPSSMQQNTSYTNLTQEIFLYFAEKIDKLKLLGVNDIILDPGFGFAKTLEQNYELLAKMSLFSQFKMPILVGISRKRMIWQLLNSCPEESLNGTSIINTLALQQGANILRVHDVKEAADTIKIFCMYNKFR